MVARRRRSDDEDDLSIVFGTVHKPSEQLEKVDGLRHALPTPNSVLLRRERRTARLARRSRRHTAKSASDADNHEEGYSTDSSLTQSDALDYQQALERIITDGRDILSDVRSAEFKDPNCGLAKWFGEWRKRYADIYIGAWGGLGLVGAWEFWVRLEILGWNPFEVYYFLPFDIIPEPCASHKKVLTNSLGIRPCINILDLMAKMKKVTKRNWVRTATLFRL